MKKRKGTRKLLLFGLVIILVLGLIFGGLQILESTVLSKGTVPEKTESLTVVRNGIEYYPRQDITVIMALGIDQLGPMKESKFYRNDGKSDAIVLMLLDDKDESFTLLCLNRDSMVEMPVLGIGGRQAGTYFGQLALSYTYGNGLNESCENTRTTVSNMLSGINIDHYIAMNMDGISIINDAVGGVKVTVTDDFSAVDSSIKKGEVTLNGQQALSYVHERKDIGNQLNISRMGRHEQYMQGLMNAMRSKLEEDESFIIELYEQISDYIVTDCSVNTMSGIMQRCADYQLKETVSPKGENVLGEQLYEFYPDEQQLDELVLRLFYAPKG